MPNTTFSKLTNFSSHNIPYHTIHGFGNWKTVTYTSFIAAAVCSADVEIISLSPRTGSSNPGSSASAFYLSSFKLAFA